jgi:hypothetical protein
MSRGQGCGSIALRVNIGEDTFEAAAGKETSSGKEEELAAFYNAVSQVRFGPVRQQWHGSSVERGLERGRISPELRE